MKLISDRNKKAVIAVIASIGALLLFAAKPLLKPALAQTASSTGGQSTENDFDRDVKHGKDDIKQDAQAQRLQNEVVDGEDGIAGEGDGENNQKDLAEFSDLRDAEDNQGENEDNQDINNSEVDEVHDANDLEEQSQEVMDEHQTQEDQETNNSEGSSSERGGTPGSDQGQPNE